MAGVRESPQGLADRLGLSLASELVSDRLPLTREAADRGPALPVTEDVAPLLPRAGLAGQFAIPAARAGATSLMWRLLAGPSTAGHWCAVVGRPEAYPLAATGAGVDLASVVHIRVQGPEQTLAALDALLEGVPVIVAPTRGLTVRQQQRAAHRARRSGSVVIWWEGGAAPVPGVDARLEPRRCQWFGLRSNAGRRWGAGGLNACCISVAATWRGRADTVRAELWPYGTGTRDWGECP